MLYSVESLCDGVLFGIGVRLFCLLYAVCYYVSIKTYGIVALCNNGCCEMLEYVFTIVSWGIELCFIARCFVIFCCVVFLCCMRIFAW